ncbi:MAG: hypothetical protein ACREO1_00855 [Arenimonas sp.]
MADITAHKQGIGIGEALRDLPLETPAQSLWPILSQQLPQPLPKKRQLRYIPLALAAGLALLAVIPMSLNSPPVIEDQTDANLQSVMQQSSQLENILVATRNSTTGNASAEVISLALEDRIHAIDAELAADTLSTPRQLSLWQQRVGLLQEATDLYSSQRYQQAEGRPYEIALVESF